MNLSVKRTSRSAVNSTQATRLQAKRIVGSQPTKVPIFSLTLEVDIESTDNLYSFNSQSQKLFENSFFCTKIFGQNIVKIQKIIG